MGKHKVKELRIIADMHGVRRVYNHGHCSYSCDSDGVDYSVRQFLQEWYDEATAAYEVQAWESQRAERDRIREKQDRAEYERLKEKFEGEG